MTLYNRKEKIKKNCQSCNKVFEVLPSRNKRKFCSMSCATRFKHKNNTLKSPAGWNKGLKMNKDWKEKLRQAKLKNPVRYWLNKKRPKLRKKREPTRRILMERMEYKRWRREVFKRDQWTCQKCGQRGHDLEAHHIKSWSEYPKLRYITSNGITYCEKCHSVMDKHRKIKVDDS